MLKLAQPNEEFANVTANSEKFPGSLKSRRAGLSRPTTAHASHINTTI